MKIVVIGEATSGSSSPATLFHIVVQRWQKQAARLFDPYRPELHYMRGPGPKSREKQIAEIATQKKISREDAAMALLRDKQPSRHFVMPGQINGTAAFLCSAMADQITGTAIAVNGARTAQ